MSLKALGRLFVALLAIARKGADIDENFHMAKTLTWPVIA